MRPTVKVTDLFQEGVQYLIVAQNVLDCYTVGEVDRSINRGNKACIHNQLYRGAGKSLARPGTKQATATEDFEFHISCL